jgi:hypothetical protein
VSAEISEVRPTVDVELNEPDARAPTSKPEDEQQETSMDIDVDESADVDIVADDEPPTASKSPRTESQEAPNMQVDEELAEKPANDIKSADASASAEVSANSPSAETQDGDGQPQRSASPDMFNQEPEDADHDASTHATSPEATEASPGASGPVDTPTPDTDRHVEVVADDTEPERAEDERTEQSPIEEPPPPPRRESSSFSMRSAMAYPEMLGGGRRGRPPGPGARGGRGRGRGRPRQSTPHLTADEKDNTPTDEASPTPEKIAARRGLFLIFHTTKAMLKTTIHRKT